MSETITKEVVIETNPFNEMIPALAASLQSRTYKPHALDEGWMNEMVAQFLAMLPRGAAPCSQEEAVETIRRAMIWRFVAGQRISKGMRRNDRVQVGDILYICKAPVRLVHDSFFRSDPHEHVLRYSRAAQVHRLPPPLVRDATEWIRARIRRAAQVAKMEGTKIWESIEYYPIGKAQDNSEVSVEYAHNGRWHRMYNGESHTLCSIRVPAVAIKRLREADVEPQVGFIPLDWLYEGDETIAIVGLFYEQGEVRLRRIKPEDFWACLTQSRKALEDSMSSKRRRARSGW